MDTSKLIAAIDNSTISPEDKAHWKEILPKLSPEKQEQLYHVLTTKTQVKNALDLVQKALDVINELETQSKNPPVKSTVIKNEKDEILKKLNNIQKNEEQIIDSESSLKMIEEKTQAELTNLRSELRSLSQDVHGSPPPSMKN